MGSVSQSPIFSNRQLYPLYARTSYSLALNNPAMLRVLDYFHWKNVALIMQNNADVTPVSDPDLLSLLY